MLSDDFPTIYAVEAPDPTPGQLYAFELRIGTTDGWIIEYVAEERRHQLTNTGCGVLRSGQVFTIVSLDDPGPWEMPDFHVHDVDGRIRSTGTLKPPKRWHVALLGDRLFWLNHELLRYSSVIGTV